MHHPGCLRGEGLGPPLGQGTARRVSYKAACSDEKWNRERKGNVDARVENYEGRGEGKILRPDTDGRS